DVGMVETGDRLGLAIEAGEGGGILGLGDRQNLERDAPAHEHVLAEIDGAHAAGAEPLEQAIFAADDKAAPAAGEQFLRLERGEKAFLDESLGQLLWRVERHSGAA